MRSSFDKRPAVKNPFRDMHARPEKERRSWSFFGGISRLLLLMCIGCVAGVAGVGVQGYLFFTQNLPSIEKLKNYEPPIVTEFYADKGELIADFASEKRYVVPIDRVPRSLVDAFVAAEDKNFWKHPGFDKEAILRATLRNLKDWRVVSGASTITQQVAKTFLLTSKKTFSRKIKEAILATRIESSLGKEQILYLYLNQIYLGSGAYGVEAASRTYFSKHVEDLSLAECAMLAGLPNKPAKNSPKVSLKNAMERRAYVLKRMHADNYITDKQYEQAMQEVPRIVSASNDKANVAPGFVEHVRRYIVKEYGADALYKEGLQVYTTVDLDLTRLARSSVDKGLRELDKRQGYRGPIQTLNVKQVMDFLADATRDMKEPLRFGQITEGVVTHIDDKNVYVRMGSYVKEGVKREYVGQIKIDPRADWWVRTPFVRPERRTRNFSEGDLPFQVGDLILVRIVDPNVKRRQLYLKKYGKQDPEMKNYKQYTEDMMTYFLLEPEQTPEVQAALMLRENRTGYVKVMLGGYSHTESQYNRAVQSRRQAGSSFKPVIYAAALNKGFTCADIILDSPLILPVPGTGEVWRPKNYGGGFKGPVTFRNALVKSRNIPTVKILQQIGIEHAKAYARKLGYNSPLVDNLTLALGSTGVSLEEQLAAYSVFPNKGYLIPSVYITKIVDRHGRIIEKHDPPVLLDDPMPVEPHHIQQVSQTSGRRWEADAGAVSNGSGGLPATRRIDEGTAYIMTTLLQGVIQEGTATRLKKIVGRPEIAGKTGTTNDNIDAWFMGFSPDYTCGVWVGFDDEVSLGGGETGGRAAAPIWGYFMAGLLKDKPVKEFTAPPSVEHRTVDPKTGLLTSAGNGVEEVFKAGSGPAAERPTLIKGTRWDYGGSDLDQF